VRSALNTAGWKTISTWQRMIAGRWTYTWVLETPSLPAPGARGLRRSEAAMKAATTNATVVKKPKAFWTRVRVLYMMGNWCSCQCSFCPRSVL
jgi:hypothetical protein